MSPTSERLLLRPSVEARVQLDCVELLCVPAEPIPGSQRGLVQDGVPVVIAPSGRTDPDVTHSSPIAAFYPPSHAGGGLPRPVGPPESKALTARAPQRTDRVGYIRSCNLAELTDDVIDVFVDYGLRIASPATVFSIFQLGGAVARVGEDETAFGGRDAGHTVNVFGITTTGQAFEAEREWARGRSTALQPHHQHVYINFLMEEGEDPRGLRRGQVRPPEKAQAHVRHEQLLPAQPEHSAGPSRPPRRALRW